MQQHWTISGKIISGLRQGAFFTGLEWVRQQCMEKLGFEPWPGTLNVEISDEQAAVINGLVYKKGVDLLSPDENFCSGKVYPVTVAGMPAAIVKPAEEVRTHGKNIVEIIAPQKLKEALEVADGDWLTFSIDMAGIPPPEL
jgi:CTP-dependent riboflavin kinase